MDSKFYIGLGLGVLILYLYLRAKRRKAKKLYNEIDAVCIQLIQDHEQVEYSPNDSVTYYGSILNNEEALVEFKNIPSFRDKDLLSYFKNRGYDSTEDNLLIYKLKKFNSNIYFTIVVSDPVNIDKNYSLFEVMGPLV